MKFLLCLLPLCAVAVVSFAAVNKRQDKNGFARNKRAFDPWGIFGKKKTTPPPTIDPLKIFGKKKTIPPSTTTLPTRAIGPIIPIKIPSHIKAQLSKLNSFDDILALAKVPVSLRQRILQSTKGLEQSIRKLSADPVFCGLYPKIIDFPQPASYLGLIYPSSFQIYQCGASCPLVAGQQCEPTGKVNLPVAAFYMKYFGSALVWEMTQMIVEIHTGCRCGCKIKESACNATRQYYNRDTCECKCKDAYKRGRVTCTSHLFMYSEEKCACVCGLKYGRCPLEKMRWDNKGCKCVCDSDIKCPKGQTIDSRTCECNTVSMSQNG